LIALPALSAALYWQLGRPEQPAAPFALRPVAPAQVAGSEGQGAGDQAVPPVEVMIEQLEQRLAAQPDDLEGWLRLGRAHMMAERFADAAGAYRKAIAVHAGVAALHAALGEALLMASGGIVTEPARAAFDQAAALDPGNVQARFYRGVGLLQQGEREAALEVWVELVRAAPATAAWLPELRRRVAGLAAELGKDPVALMPDVAAAPGPAPTTAAGPAATAAEVEQLAARLAAEPKDWEGWISLTRGLTGLGRQDEAGAALDQAAAVYAGAPFVLQQFATVAAELSLGGADSEPSSRGPSAEQVEAVQAMPPAERDEMIRGMVEGLAARLEEQPDDPEGWRMLGRSWSVLGDTEQSAKAYRRLAEIRPDDLDAQLEYAGALLAKGEPEQPLEDDTISQLERVLTLDANQPQALFHLGQAAAERGDTATAAGHWQRLLDQLPADTAEHAEVRALLDGLAVD
jgi:cytochrome c-type biogenesis protein CcmH